MIFSSAIFLYLFLPLTLSGYYLVRKSLRNYWLLFASLVFFAWGGVSYTVILIASIAVNYTFGLLINNSAKPRAAWHWLCAGVTINLLLLAVFKYANFTTRTINAALSHFSSFSISETNILLPIGISFYTFHLLSYLVDIYRHKSSAQKNVFDLALYIAMFSQLIAGPIIRYSDVCQQLRSRTHSLIKFSEGVERFLIGLGKKVLIANTLGNVADTIFNTGAWELGAPNAWLGIVCYTLQIYCDFSGYSDMAIGLGKMFGFDFLENFNYPYLSQSFKEFWRRWHISLSSFFRDYVYIPMGGNKAGKARTYFNLVFVFLLTGLWHGAGWNFIAWGLFHGFFILIEKAFLEKILSRWWKIFAVLYTFMAVMFGWVLFRAGSLHHAAYYWKAMFDFHPTAPEMTLFYSFFNHELIIVMLVALAGSFGLFRLVHAFIKKSQSPGKRFGTAFIYSYHVSSALVYTLILILSSMYLIAGTYNPFIYYRF